ncbi:hypothetical protein L3Q82_006877 [Scortum barcoo]|uniref:Uncharacterized protein n=1 Tax=Scortum barcoo TaxID=214431 RepID=A0ACB8WWA0_9TELE|nr:hypothetical protein L3Q82_006877 [Scortum barcoo]
MSNSSRGLSLVLPLTSFGNVLMFLFNISLAATIIFLNVSVSLSILMSRALRSENRFMYMLSTCFSDICTGVSYYYVGVLDVRDSFESPTRTFYIVPTFLGLSYMAILAAQADRYHVVVSPFTYSQCMTRNRTLLVIFTYWVYAFFIVAVHNLVPVGVARTITSLGTFAGNIFTVIIMIGLNIRLFIIARFQLERDPPSEERDSKRSSVYLILVVAASFLVTWLPIFCHITACSFMGVTCYTFKNEGTDPLRILPRVNASITPILYIRGCTAIRATLLNKVWRPCCGRRGCSFRGNRRASGERFGTAPRLRHPRNVKHQRKAWRIGLILDLHRPATPGTLRATGEIKHYNLRPGGIIIKVMMGGSGKAKLPGGRGAEKVAKPSHSGMFSLLHSGLVPIQMWVRALGGARVGRERDRERAREGKKERRKVEMELPNHAKQLLLQLNQQRAKGFLCDVIIVVENALFRAHKNILAASSIYFKSLVLHDNLINLDTEMVNPSVFRQVLDFIYTGKLLSSSDQSSEQNFSALLTAASYLQLHDLAALCRKKLKRSGGKPLPGKPSTPGPISRLRLNNQRLSSSTPTGPNNHYPPTPSDADQPQPDEGIRDKLSDDEMFVGSSGRNGNGGNGSSNGNLSSGGSAGEPDLGLDLSKKSPPSAGGDTCGSENMDLNSSSKASEETPNQPDGPPPQKKSRQGARKNEWPKKEASGLKSEDHDKPLVNGVIVGPKDGRSSGVGGGSGSSFASDQSFQCKDEDEGGENGQDHSDESGQSDGESAGGRGGTGVGHQSANYVSEQLNAHVETHTEDELYIKEEGGTFVKEEDEEEAEDLSAPRGTMTRHMRSHLGLKPFACEECGMRFTRQYRLTEHMRVHSGEKPYECQLCGGKFTQQRNLISHLRMHTSPS